MWGEKIRNARDAGDTRPIETTYRQRSVDKRVRAGLGWERRGQPVLEAQRSARLQRSLAGRRHIRAPREQLHARLPRDGQSDVQPGFEISTGVYGRSFHESVFLRPTNSVDVTTTYFLPASSVGTTRSRPATAGAPRTRPAESYAAATPTPFHGGHHRIPRRSGAMATRATRPRHAGAVSAGHGHATTADAQSRRPLGSPDDEALAASVPAHPFTPKHLPSLNFPGADPGVVWNDISPRLGHELRHLW